MGKTYSIQIRFSDIDAMGIVHNAIYFEYFEQARLLFFRDLVGHNWDWKTQGVIVARNEADYIQPVSLNEEVVVEVFCYSLGTTSFCLGYKVMSRNGNDLQLKARGQSVMVCYNSETKTKTAIYEAWRDKLLRFRGDF